MAPFVCKNFFKLHRKTGTGRVKPIPVPVPVFKNLPHTYLQPVFITHSNIKRDGFFEFQTGTGFIAIPRLASNGFNPFRTVSTTHSIWAVILIPYNSPRWLCIKQSSFILSMIIPGEKGPGNNIDIHLQPLIHALKQWWEGVDAYDAFAKEHFKL